MDQPGEGKFENYCDFLFLILGGCTLSTLLYILSSIY